METIIKQGNRNYKIDTTGKQITFLDSRFYYSPAGNFLPSVTTILEAYPKGAQYYEWLKKNGQDSDEIRDEAGRRGSVVHELTEMYDAGTEISLLDNNGNVGYKLSEWNMLSRYAEFCNNHPFNIIHSEQNIVSDQLGYAGTIDRIIDVAGETWLVDIKTSNAIYQSYWLQVAAYKNMVEVELDMKIDKVGILWLNAKTRTTKEFQGPGWQLVLKDNTDEDLRAFKATNHLWAIENGSMKPKHLSYALSIKAPDKNDKPAAMVCKRCGVVDDIVIAGGKGPHFATINCGSCGAYIKWATEKEVNNINSIKSKI